ncbi:MAG: hypothetical protein HY735_01875 [Verrucomicrobia bacterium]|nr:hypothetical protein [Verrucomicrobiota bacterium]
MKTLLPALMALALAAANTPAQNPTATQPPAAPKRSDGGSTRRGEQCSVIFTLSAQLTNPKNL